MDKMLQGIPVSGGIAIGEAVIVDDYSPETGSRERKDSGEQNQMERFADAVLRARKDLQKARQNLVGSGRELAGIIDVQLMLLEDPRFVGAIKSAIAHQGLAAIDAVNRVKSSLSEEFRQQGDVLLTERIDDLADLADRLTGYLRGEKTGKNLLFPAVVAGKQLFSSQIAGWDKNKILGLAAEEGGTASHAAIMARGLGIPAVFGVKGMLSYLEDGDRVIIDGHRGEVHINPQETLKQEYERYQKEEIRSEMPGNREPAVTLDNVEITLMANVFVPEEASRAMAYGAAGIGLVRTELIFETLPNWPSEEEQVRIYRSIINRMPGLPITIRTLDIGGDKQLPYTRLPAEENPFLGLRGLRFSLDREEIFKTQLRAILRAGAGARVRLLLPMVSDIGEVKRVRKIMEEVGENLRRAAMNFDHQMELGVMIEVPSAALTVDILAGEADFFSIGTNDLVQYTLAVDRNNKDVANLYDPLHPSVLRLIDQVVSDAQTAGRKVSICGEMAGDLNAVLILLGMGVREFSINPDRIPAIKELCSNIEIATLRQEVSGLVELNSAGEIRRELARFREEHLPNL